MPSSPIDDTTNRCRQGVARITLLILILFNLLWLRIDLIKIEAFGGPDTFPDNAKCDEDHLKYGSVGSDTLKSGIPYAFFRVLPIVFSDLLPQQHASEYKAMGFLYEPNRDRPIGFSKRRIGLRYSGLGLDMVGLNCGLCHVSAIQNSKDGFKIIAGMPGQTADAEAFFVFLFKVAHHPDFKPDVILAAIEEDRGRKPLRFFPKIGYWLLTHVARMEIQQLEKKFCFLHEAPTKRCPSQLTRLPAPAGPGRIDTWAPYKVLRLQAWPDLHERPYTWLRLDLLARLVDSVPEILPLPALTSKPQANGPVVGFADAPALWNLDSHIGRGFHWDGNTVVLSESASIAAVGLTAPATIDMESLNRVARWARAASPPRWDSLAPDDGHRRYKIDQEKAGRGLGLYNAHCASCHHPSGEWFGRSLPVGEIGTDRNRYDAFTDALAAKFNTKVGVGYPWKPQHFSPRMGYSNVPLDGIWLRAPYLHNGSIPTLWHLLHRPCDPKAPSNAKKDCRPTVFYRGNDVYDWENVGFIWNEPERGTFKFFRYDTTIPGNGNGGHFFGVDLERDEKEALLEYLKKL